MIHYSAVQLDLSCAVSVLIVIIVWRVIRLLLLLYVFVCAYIWRRCIRCEMSAPPVVVANCVLE